MRNFIASLLVGFWVAGCATGYTLVSPNSTVAVSKGSMKVRPAASWNKQSTSYGTIAQEENWTRNGPLLDNITFIGGLKDGEAIAKQKAKDDRKVPVFHASMNPQDLVSMVEAYYRIKMNVTVFETTGVTPATLGGKPAIQYDYNYVAGDDVKRRGRSMLAINDGRLYMMSLDGTASHYFDAALPEFEEIVKSAVIS